MKKLFTIFLMVVFAAIIFGCGSDDHDHPVKTRDFQSPEEFMQNPSIQDALAGSDMITNMGYTPPRLVGDYSVTGTVVNSNLPQMVGQKISSDVCLHNQTSSGLIDYTETASGVTITAFGNYITGANGSFTIWQEGDVQAYGCQQHNAIIISGTKLANGDLQVKTLTINLEKQNCEAYAVPEWFETNAYFSLEGDGGDVALQKTITLYPIADTYISSTSPDANYGKENSIGTGNYTETSYSDLYGFVKFDLSEIPDDATIVNATLWMATAFNNTYTKPTGTTQIYQVGSSWNEDWLTYNNKPWYYLSPSSSRDVIFETGDLYGWDVRVAVDYWIKLGRSNYGFTVKTTDISVGELYYTAGCYFYSKESSWGSTRLTVTYIP